MMTQYAIITDLNRCVSCLACVVACKQANDVPIGNFWLKVLRIGPNLKEGATAYPDVEMYYLPMSCQHCKNPLCVDVCPTGASAKKEDGTVQIDKEKCIGCQFCVMACPYGVRYLNETERVVEKCTLCEQITESGHGLENRGDRIPRCVYACQGRARWFGDLDKGLDDFQGTLKVDGVTNYRLTEVLPKDEIVVKPYSDSDVYELPDAGNKPTGKFILRNRKWRS
jgi:Fe-S-cluster-containing dehydrogenase component